MADPEPEPSSLEAPEGLSKEAFEFFSEGRTVESASANEAFFLKGAKNVWLVLHGAVDVFAVELDEDQPIGPRHFLFSITPGNLLYGLDLETYDVKHGLLAVGIPGTRVLKFDAARLAAAAARESLRSEMMRFVDDLVMKIGVVVAGRNRPMIDLFVEAGSSVALEDMQCAAVKEGVVWARVESGLCLYDGRDTSRIEPSSGFVPLSPSIWLTASKASVISVVSTKTFLERDKSLEGLEILKSVYAGWVAAGIRARLEAERLRIGERITADAAVKSVALASLASVLDEESSGSVADVGGDPLLSALKALEPHLHVTFRPPPRWAGEQRGADPVDAICRASHLRSRRVALRGEWWNTDSGAILGFEQDTNHPLAIVPVTPGRYEIYDPADGHRVPATEESAARLQPFGFIFYLPFPTEPLETKKLFSHGIHSIRRDVIGIVLVTIAAGLLGMATPYASGEIFSDIIPYSNRPALAQVLAALLAATIAAHLFTITRAIAIVRIQGLWGTIVQAAVWDRLMNLPVPFFRKFTVGELAQRAEGIDHVRQMLSSAALTTFLNGSMGAFQFLLMFWLSAKLALMMSAVSLVFFAATFFFSALALRYQKEAQMIAGRVSGFLFQAITGIAKLRVAGAEPRAFAVWAELFKNERRLAFKVGRMQNYVTIFSSFLPTLSTFALFGMIHYLSDEGVNPTIEIGTFISFNAAYSSFLNSALSMVDTCINLLLVVPALERIKPILDQIPESDISRPDPGRLSGRIDVNQISFRYDKDGPWILDKVSWKAEPGEFIAFVGPSGSGKSTMLRLLLGFEKPDVGKIYFGGHDVEAVDITAIRRQMGVVLQGSRVRAGSIKDNILGLTTLGMDDAWRAAEMAGIAEDIRKMPMGMHTIVTEGGSTFSGGQKQRLMIARSVVRTPRVIILDEATSALDNHAQKIVSDSLDRMNATRIVIAHRLSTIRNAHRIYVMQDGKIVQSGGFDELSAQPGLFADLIKRQVA